MYNFCKYRLQHKLLIILLIVINMRKTKTIQLSAQPQFTRNISPIVLIKQKQSERKKQQKMEKLNYYSYNRKPKVSILDPLLSQLQTYRQQTTINKIIKNSNGRLRLRNYILEQQKNLKCLRVDKQRPPNSERKFRSQFLGAPNPQITAKQIMIPEIKEMFANQQKQYLLFQKKLLSQILDKAITSIDNKIIKPSMLGDEKLHKTLQEDDFDSIINNKLKTSYKLMEKIKALKKQQSQKGSLPKNNHSFYRIKEPQVKNMSLKGVKTISISDRGRNLQVTPACSVLFQMKKLNQQKEDIQLELNKLVTNSGRNRPDNLEEKSTYFQVSNSYNDLSPSNQFRMRKHLNQKLFHRLELSKDQVESFTKFLYELRNVAHVIVSESTLSILQQVREMLLEGKIMKMEDLNKILKRYQIQKHEQVIIQKVKQMMI